MSIFNYNKFINNKQILEGLREMKFVLSKRIIDILKNIDHEISDELLKIHNDLDFNSRQTFIDVCLNRDDYITFIQSNKASDILEIDDDEKYINFDKNLLKDLELNHPVYKQYRGEMKFGKLINNIFGRDKFASSLEGFIRMYKSKFNQEEKFELMELVSGEDIFYWYDCDNNYNSSGSLGSSCMASSPKDHFGIYIDNPDKIKMLILYSGARKASIKARAIVWQDLLMPEGKTFMDRVYTNNSADEQLFVDYAIKNNWIFKKNQSFGESVPLRDENGNSVIKVLNQLRSISYERYPYMDTLVFYNPDTGKISNKGGGMQLRLQGTDGYYEEMDESEYNEVYSNYHGEYIYEIDAKWCSFGEDWVHSGEAIRVFNGGGRYAVPGHPDIVRCNIPGIVDKHFEKERCIWSDFLNTWIFKTSVRKVWTNYEKTNFVIDYKKRLDDSFVEIDGEFWSMKLVEKDGDIWKLKEN